jgi:hypothetical protein
MMRARCLAVLAAMCQEITTEDCELGDRLFLLPSLTGWEQLRRSQEGLVDLEDLIAAVSWLRDNQFTDVQPVRLPSGAEVDALWVLAKPHNRYSWPVQASRVERTAAPG